jgi:hypothetical protein
MTSGREVDLLFPSLITGELQSKSALQKPFNNVAKALGLKKRITPKAMRRSFKDIARAAGVEAVVRKAVSGHATDRMEQHYSTAGAGEKEGCHRRRGEHQHCEGEACLGGVSIWVSMALKPLKS